MILVANTSFPEVNYIAAMLAREGLLSKYVRPYANMGRGWEQGLGRLPGFGRVYSRTFGRRRIPVPLQASEVCETGLIPDLLSAVMGRVALNSCGLQRIQQLVLRSRTRAVMTAAQKAFEREYAVVASWGCAEEVFRVAKDRGRVCILNYPIAHHRFTQRYLLEEVERNPDFRDSITIHRRPVWEQEQLDSEVELADYILVGSTFVRDSFIAEGVSAEKIRVIPYGADTQLFCSGNDRLGNGDRLQLLFVGQIGQRKGISYLLKAVQSIRSRGVSLTLVGKIQGSGRGLVPYRESFLHLPHVPHEDLATIYRKADVFVFPTVLEGMGIVVLEAMASGLPVITTPNGPGDIVRDGVDGFLVPPRDVSAIVDRIEFLRKNPDVRREMGFNASERAQKFTWKAYQRDVLSFLRETAKCLEYRE